jgi:predicted AlkP superfamily pyrophosphatase or phosphodiesterase
MIFEKEAIRNFIFICSLIIIIGLIWAIRDFISINASPSVLNDNRIIVLVIDGLRPDYITPDIMPNLSIFRENGFSGQNHHAVYPTSTRINSASIATGTYPNKHGLLNNSLYLSEVSLDRILNTKKISDLLLIDKFTNGHLLTTISLGEILQNRDRKLFISSSGASGSAYLLNHKPGTGTLLHREIVQPESLSPVVEKLLGPVLEETTRPHVKTVKRSVDAIFKIGIEIINADVIIGWITEPDGTAHSEGIGAPLTIEALKFVDNEIARISEGLQIRGILKSTNIIIVSDHGFSTRIGEKSISSLLIDHELKSDESSTDVIIANDAIYVNKQKEKLIPQVVRLLQKTAWIGPIFTDGKNSSSNMGWVPGTLSFSTVMWDHERSSDILTAGNWSDKSNKYGYKGDVSLPGVAGHNSTSPFDIKSTFLASGPDFKSQTKSTIPTGNVDLVPTVLHLLGIKVPDSIDGRIIREALNKEPSPSEIQIESKEFIAETRVENIKYKVILHKTFVDGTAYVDSTVTLREYSK